MSIDLRNEDGFGVISGGGSVVTYDEFWHRNPDWLSLPTITSVDDKFAGLYLVFEDGYNFVTFTLGVSGATDYDVDFGDGTTTNYTGSISQTYSHTFDYATLGGAIKVDPRTGRNYKQSIITIVVNSGLLIQFNGDVTTTINNGGTLNWADVSMSFPNMSSLTLSGVNKRWALLERLAIYNNAITAPTSLLIQNLFRLGEFIFEPVTLTSLASEFTSIACKNGYNITSTTVTSFATMSTTNNLVERIGNLSSTVATTCNQMCINSKQLISVGDLTMPLCTIMTNTFQGCDSLTTVGVIDAPLVDISAIGNAAISLQGFEFTNLTNCTTTTSAFNLMVSMEFLIVTGITVGFSVSGTKMGAQALNDMFTSLGTASGAQTIIVTNTPGASTCDTTIATAKGFTVTI